jgi:hypothetical protein
MRRRTARMSNLASAGHAAIAVGSRLPLPPGLNTMSCRRPSTCSPRRGIRPPPEKHASHGRPPSFFSFWLACMNPDKISHRCRFWRVQLVSAIKLIVKSAKVRQVGCSRPGAAAPPAPLPRAREQRGMSSCRQYLESTRQSQPVCNQPGNAHPGPRHFRGAVVGDRHFPLSTPDQPRLLEPVV